MKIDSYVNHDVLPGFVIVENYNLGQDILLVKIKRFVLTGKRLLLKFRLGRPAAQTPSRSSR
jgi:hypothetical protein